MSLANEVEELQRKAGSYDLLKEEYNRLKSKIKETIKDLNLLLGELGEKKSINKGVSAKPYILKYYERLKTEDGYQLTREILKKELDSQNIDIPLHTIQNIINGIKNMKGIVSVKDGTRLRLFYDKTKYIN